MIDFIKKIEKNYNFSLQYYDYSNLSKYWQYSIQKKKKLFKINKLSKFRSNHLNRNIDDFYVNKKDFETLLKKVEKKCGEKFLRNFSLKDNIGYAKKKINYYNKILTPTDLFLIDNLYDLKKKINFNKVDSICEIGGGFGLLASKFLKLKDFKYFLIDLPESNFLSAYFLNKHFPQKKIIMDMDLKKNCLDLNTIKNADIFIISPWIKINKKKFDFFINTRSMMEMNSSTLKNYFKFIQNRITENGFFFCLNRYYKDLVGYPVEFHKYPFDNNWKVIISKQFHLQKNSHFLLVKRSRLPSMDMKVAKKHIYFEYKKCLKTEQFFLRRVLPPYIYRAYKKVKFFFLDFK